jgi:predicted dehydrogenase
MIRLGLIGYGYWGPNLARNITANPEAELAVVCDSDPVRLAETGSLYPGVRRTTLAQEVIDDTSISAIVIATPLASHFELSMAALQTGKHVLIEKPMASTSDQAEQMAEEAARRKLVLLVDHTFVYTGAVRKMRDLVREAEFGQLRYYDSTRVNLGLFRRDTNVVWDLAVHDLSIMTYLLEAEPIAISATGHCHIAGHSENIAFLSLFFDNNVIAHVNVNWLSPVKIRRTIVAGSKQTIVYNDLEASEKLKIYHNSIDVAPAPEETHKLLVSYRTGDIWAPKVDDTEALGLEIAHFLACVKGEQTPITGAREGLKIIRMLEAADRSIQQNGARVEL